VVASAAVFVAHTVPAALHAVAALLRGAGHTVQPFDRAPALVQAAAAAGAGCAVVDLRLRAEVLACALPLVFLAGDGAVSEAVLAMKDGAVDVLLEASGDAALLDAVDRALTRDAEARRDGAALGTLTARERDVCDRVAQGMLNKQIAVALDLSEATVKVHRARGMTKLGVASSAELALLLSKVRGR
jgi:FixJ family two-component response regulator